MRPHVSSLLLLGLLACTSTGTATRSEPPASAHAQAPLPFIEDDYPGALSAAKARGVPLFVDTWAPWCHTCRSMRAFVFTDPALARHAERF
ncbi:MAG TPA: thioredoxin family protein, partial [Myxococcaceae bacterium]|nr:thioredoxin family protein [Myxococcaceae bacterium]